MEKATRARKAETPKQPSLSLRLRAPYLYPDRAVGDLAHVEKFFARKLGGLVRVRKGTPDRFMKATAVR